MIWIAAIIGMRYLQHTATHLLAVALSWLDENLKFCLTQASCQTRIEQLP